MRLFSTALDVKVLEALSLACVGVSRKNWDPLSQVASVSEFQYFEIKKILYFLARGVCEMPKLTELESKSNACLSPLVAVSVIVVCCNCTLSHQGSVLDFFAVTDASIDSIFRLNGFLTDCWNNNRSACKDPR
jgi:hypothetical protein